MKKGSFKIANKYVHEDDMKFHGFGITVWQRGDVCVARREDGIEGRAQLTDHGAGNKSVQVFSDNGSLIEDISTKF